MLGLGQLKLLLKQLLKSVGEMKKRILVAAGISMVLVMGMAGIGVAQEGTFGTALQSAARTVTQVFGFQAEEETQEVAEPEQTEETEEQEEVSAPPEPITYPNGFTEGEIRGETPTFSDSKFVPDGLKEAEVDSCATASDYDKCVEDKFVEFWDAQKPAGSDWKEIRFGDSPQFWMKTSTKETRMHQKTMEYLDANMHKHISGLRTPTVNLNTLRWDPAFELENQGYFYYYNEALSNAPLNVVFENPSETISEVRGRLGYDFGSNSTTHGYVEINLDFLPPCTEGNLKLEALVGDIPGTQIQKVSSESIYYSNISQQNCPEAEDPYELDSGFLDLKASTDGGTALVNFSVTANFRVSDFVEILSAELLIAGLDSAQKVEADSISPASGFTEIRFSEEAVYVEKGSYTFFLRIIGTGDSGKLINLHQFENNGESFERKVTF